jgi:uncharacterized membrane protein
MDATTHWIEAMFRWLHVVAGVMWIGFLYFFNFVNAQLGPKLDAETKKKVIPELMPRTLYFFRWGAAYTWVSGFMLLGLVYYMQKGNMVQSLDSGPSAGMVMGVSVTVMLFGFFIYDGLWKALASKPEVGAAVSFLLVAGLLAGFHYGLKMAPRGLFMHLGAVFGTFMAMNVWMRIWPSQRKIIAAIKNGEPPPADRVAIAGLRSKHNTYMSVPLIYSMVASHHGGALHYQADPSTGNAGYGWTMLLFFIAVGWAVVFWLYKKSAKPEVAAF